MSSSSANYRKAIALLALVSAFVALYLHLWKLGLMGPLTCTANHGCEVAMMSSWGTFAGHDVALLGTMLYVVILLVSFAGLQPRWQHSAAPAVVIFALALAGTLFTWRLKYGEWVVLHTFCIWCAENLVTIHLVLLLSWLDWRELRAHSESACDNPVGAPVPSDAALSTDQI